MQRAPGPHQCTKVTKASKECMPFLEPCVHPCVWAGCCVGNSAMMNCAMPSHGRWRQFQLNYADWGSTHTSRPRCSQAQVMPASNWISTANYTFPSSHVGCCANADFGDALQWLLSSRCLDSQKAYHKNKHKYIRIYVPCPLLWTFFSVYSLFICRWITFLLVLGG